jgi:hypothetical protein
VEKIAAAQLKSLLPTQYQWMQTSAIALEKLFDDDWIYQVTFEYIPPTVYTGEPRLFTIPVYLDGSVIIPKIQKEK